MEKEQIALFPITEFRDGIPELYAPLENYIINVMPLMLEHIWQRKHGGLSTATEELAYSGWLCRLITLDKRVLDPVKQYEIAGWSLLKDQLLACIDDCTAEENLSDMIDRCMRLIEPVISKRFIKDYVFPARAFHCWWYTMHENDTHVALHLVNAYQPQSPFDNTAHFLQTMLQAVEEAKTRYPQISLVLCGSWLNALPAFQKCWPPAFTQNQRVLNTSGGFGPGAWGQYMKSDGSFHPAKAAMLKKNGLHPYPLTEAFCRFNELKDHLVTLINE